MTEETFSDPELAFLRHARFGALPTPVAPEERVELMETEPRQDWPERGPSRAQWEVGGAGG